MLSKLLRSLVVGGLLALLFACSQETEGPALKLLDHVPAETPYVFVTSRKLPAQLGERMGDFYATQLASQRAAFASMREQWESSAEIGQMIDDVGPILQVVDALLAEFEGRGSAKLLRELGIEPSTRSVLYGVGLLPALRMEIADADRLNAMLDRVERRAGHSALRGELNGQAYRRIDLGSVDAVLAVTGDYAVAGLLPDKLFDRHLPLLLGIELPTLSLAESGAIEAMNERHDFTGYGEGFIRLDELLAILQGRGEVSNAEVMQALVSEPLPIPAACLRMTDALLAYMPRLVTGVTTVDEQRLVTRSVWESSPGVANYLQGLAAPVPGVGGTFDGLLMIGMGMDLPRLRTALEALLREVIAAGRGCDWVDGATLRAAIPKLNLALGPMTAGIKGFNLLIENLAIDRDTLQPIELQAGLLAAVDDPRGVFGLGAMFNPALAALRVPEDGTPVDLPRDLGPPEGAPAMKVAIKDKALLLLAGPQSAELAATLVQSAPLAPSPLLALDYGIHQLVERFGELMELAAMRLEGQGEVETAQAVREQLAGFRQQAALFDRLRVAVYASEHGLVMDQVMELR